MAFQTDLLRHAKALALGAGLLLSVAGCATYRDAADVALVGLTNEQGAGKSIGRIEGKDCGVTVFGYGRQEYDLTINKALDRSRKENGLRYVRNLSVEREATDILVYRRVCIIVAGMGYK